MRMRIAPKLRRLQISLAAVVLHIGLFAAPAGHAEPLAWSIDATDQTLRQALTRWSRSAGWQLVWELPVDFPIEARASFDGGFEDAVGAVAHSMERSDAPLKAIFYRGNNVLRIVAKGAQ